MKKKLFLEIVFIICLCMVSCGKKGNTPKFADGLFVEIYYTPNNINSEEMTYTIHAKFYQDATVCIYADDFSKWYGEDEPEKFEFKIDEIEQKNIKNIIIDEDIYNLRDDIGNKDNMDGVKKSITVYTVKGSHTVYGINPSNRNFNKVYDYISGVIREEISTYISYISDIQEKGINNDVGLCLNDSAGVKVFGKEEIKDIYCEKNLVNDTKESNENNHNKIVIELKDDSAKKLESLTDIIGKKDMVTFELYNDNVFFGSFFAYKNTDDGKIYSSQTYEDEEIEEIVEELKEGMD